MSREEEKELLGELNSELNAELIFTHLRDMWAVDGLYFLGIEERFGTEAATQIDADVWKTMGKIEARRLKKLLGIDGSDLMSMIRGLKYSGWAMDLEDKAWEYHKDRVILRNVRCRVQNTRIRNDLNEFPCKRVRWGFLGSFAREFNPEIKVKCIMCPPDDHPEDLWCEWEFSLRT